MKRVLVVLFLILVPIQASAYFKCTDSQGEVSFQEFPCPDPIEQVEEAIRGEHKSESSQSENSQSANSRSQQEALLKNQKYTEEFLDDAKESLVEVPVIIGKISSALASLSPLKMILTQYNAVNGKWPDNFSDVGVSDLELTSSQIEDIRLEAEGVIVAKLSPGVGVDKYIAIQPRYVLGGTTVEWVCFANFTKAVLNYGGSGACESRMIQ